MVNKWSRAKVFLEGVCFFTRRRYVRGRLIRMLKLPLLFNGPPLRCVEFNVPGVDTRARNPPPVTWPSSLEISSQGWLSAW
jgi:hypothetical protein